ncbi:MAG TPA: hypothetical protein EYQ50_11490 [Verrucomicrobiales bacterium]|nr:hypothetical protein [Verrucomicrobiales bacterium]
MSGRQSLSPTRRCTDDTSRQPGDLPDWELGFSITLPESGNEIPGWHSDIIAAGQFLAMLSFEFPSEFVIGFVDTRTGISEDLHFVQPADADLNRLRALIDVGEIE